MTPQSIHDHIHASFTSIYPGKLIDVVGAGTEVICVDVWLDTRCNESVTWSCELDSDDDGAFWFTYDELTLKIPYPED